MYSYYAGFDGIKYEGPYSNTPVYRHHLTFTNYKTNRPETYRGISTGYLEFKGVLK